jgi:hypothetical protein
LRPDPSSPFCVYSDLPIWYEIVKRRFRLVIKSKEEVIGAKARFDPEKCQKEIFAPLPAVLLEGLLTRLSRV